MNVALMAHDSKKKLMENLCIAYRHILVKHELHSTDTTGRLIEENTNLHVNKFLSGHLGGEQQLGSLISHNSMDLVIFLRDHSVSFSSDSDQNVVFKLCDVHNIPLGTNLATAEALIMALDRGDLDWRNILKD